jgi:hypothetical protein
MSFRIDRNIFPPMLPDIIRQNRSIILDFRKEWKDFLQSFLLDPFYAKKVFRGTESPQAIPFLNHGGCDLVGDSGKFRDLPHGGLVNIYSFSKEIFLPDREWTGFWTFCGKDSRFVSGGRVNCRRTFVPFDRREKPD